MPLSRKYSQSLKRSAHLPLSPTIGLLNCWIECEREMKYEHGRPRKGAASIEFAIVAPIFFLIVFGIIENGRMLMLQHALTNAAREGCRTAGLASSVDASQVEAAVRDHLKSALGNTANNTSKLRVTLPSTLSGISSETDLTVAVEVDYADASWLPLSYLGANPLIAAEARRKRE